MMHRAETMRCGACSNFIPARSRRAPKRGFCRLAGHNTCVSESTRVCAVDEQCAACAEECGVNDGTLLLVIAVLRLTIAPLERHMTDEGQAMLQWILRNAAAVDLTDAQK